ncbi:MAG: DNA polymerase III subunit beta [Eggerthellaceae bacterium]|nr:DNA polymerase III subunit beta [Eggerthellaceae bacterium]
MRFSINQSELLNALTVVQKGISQRSTLPILSGVYVGTRGDEVSFQSTDLEMSVQYTVAALIDEPGAAVLPGKLFIDIVKNLPDAAVHIEASEDGAIISCESSSFSIRSLNAADFPGFPEVLPEQQISVPFDAFSSMARKVCRVVSKDESRMILTGVLISVEGGVLRLVATDSYRLAVTEHPLENSQADFSAVLAGGFVSDLAGLPRTGEDISFALAENQIIVSYGGTVFVNRRIEGKYPNYKQLIPASYETRCLVSRSAFAAAVKRASLLDSSGSQVKFSINEPSQTIQLNTTQEVGSTQEIVKAQVEGADVEIGFNSYYVTEGLSAMDSSEVSFELQGSLKPGIMRGAGDERYLYLVMPVRI